MDSDDNDDDDDIIVGDVELESHDDNDDNDHNDDDESSNDDASEDNSYDDAEVFVYAGEGGAAVPLNVVSVRVDPSVRSIPYRAFYGRKKLTEVELCEGLVEFGDVSFAFCGEHSITYINIPTSLRRIEDEAFSDSLQTPICLHDGIESIGNWAFGA
jgi:hypothetical protein